MDKKNIKKNNPEIDRKTYQFKCGITASQEEPTYKSDKKILTILKKLEIGDVKNLNELQIGKLLSLLLEQDILIELLDIILIDKQIPAGKSLENLTRAEIIQVMKDFFDFSPELKALFGTGKLVQALQSLN